jgi:hypothetical protein
LSFKFVEVQKLTALSYHYLPVVKYWDNQDIRRASICTPKNNYVHHTTLSVMDILVSLEFYLSMDLNQDFNWKMVLIKRPNGLPSSLLIMLIILQSQGLKEANFCDFKDFQDFEAVFHQIFTGSRYLGFTKSGSLAVIFTHALNVLKRLDSRLLLRGASRPLFCIMHALLLSMN